MSILLYKGGDEVKENIIVENARKLFNKYGYKRVTMDEIAKAAGVTKKTVYAYFSSKEELLQYFISEEIHNMKKIVEEVEKEDIQFFEKIHIGIYRLLEYRKKVNLISIISDEYETFKNPIILNNLKQIENMVQNYIKEKLIYAESKGFIDVEDIDITTFLIYKMYIALIFEWEDRNIDDSKLADNIIKILKNGLERRN